MQVFQLIETVEALDQILENEESKLFLTWLDILESGNNRILYLFGDILDAKAEVITAKRIDRSRNEIDGIISNIKLHIKAKAFFRNLEIMQEVYINFINKLAPSRDSMIGENYIRPLFSNLELAYATFIESYTYSSTLKLIFSAKEFKQTILNLNDVTNFISNSLQTEHNFDSDETLSSLSLFIDSDYTFKEFISKLEAIQNLYSELCFVFDISEVDFPLRIIKVESGSLWVKLFGETKVIETIISLIQDAKEYGYRKITREGKIETEKENLKAIESALEIRKKMQDANIDVEEFDETIKKSSIIIMNNLNTLLSGGNTIKLNGELIQSDDTSQKLLKGRDRYLLEGSKETTEDNE